MTVQDQSPEGQRKATIHRIAFAMEFGYLDARAAINVYQTHGLPLAFIAQFARSHGLQMDWASCECELQMQCDMEKGKAQSAVAEAKSFERFLSPLSTSDEVEATRYQLARLLFPLQT